MLYQQPSPVVGKRLIASRYGNDDTFEADDEFYYFTHDTGGDLCAWRFKKPDRVNEQQMLQAFQTERNFLQWIQSKGSEISIQYWW